MEVPSRATAEQRVCDIQEIADTIERIERIEEDPSKRDNIDDGSRCAARHDFTSSRAIGHARGEMLDGGTEVILLRQEPARNRREATAVASGQQVIELSDSDCKLALRRQLELVDSGRGDADTTRADDSEDAEILRRLPPDTVVIRQGTKSGGGGDYRELTETNSSSGGSSSGRAAAKVKRIRRAVRNKTRETMEVRRNPIRVTKKDVDKDFPRPRQRLLANNRREVCPGYEPGKRARASATPYMNTRSVTRKMYTVGATYQAPTRRDETEWKEWPAHGMHERPVYHPQVGLAMECLGRYFTSLDGESYCEIVDEPEIEVVAVDPRSCDRRPSSAERKPAGRMRVKGKWTSSAKDAWNGCLPMKDSSFETCMHGSFHSVLGYCSQVMAPSYRQALEVKPMATSTVPAASTSAACDAKSLDRSPEQTKLLEGYAIAMAQSVQNKSTVSGASARRLTSSATYVPEAHRRTAEVEGASKTTARSGRMSLPTLRGFPSASLVLLKSSGARTSVEPGKVKDASSLSDETLSSIYKKLVTSANEPASSREELPARNSFYALKRQAVSAREYSVKRTVLENQLENARTVQVARKIDENGNVGDAKIRQMDGGMCATRAGKNRAWCTSETSEIARILSEYNKSTTRKSAIQIYGAASRGVKTSFANPSAKGLTKAAFLWQKDTLADENQNVSIDSSVGLDLSQRKCRRLPVTLEKIRNVHVSDQSTWDGSSTSSENRQSTSKDRQMNESALSYAREKRVLAQKHPGEQREVVVADARPKGTTPECSKDNEISKTEESLQELLENTAILYCAASGVHQDDLSSYIDTLDGAQSIQWLESWNNSIV